MISGRVIVREQSIMVAAATHPTPEHPTLPNPARPRPASPRPTRQGITAAQRARGAEREVGGRPVKLQGWGGR